MKISEYEIDGVVIDPDSGRLCASMSDLARGLNLAPQQIANTRATRYQNRFFDVLEVIEARKNTPPRGRPRLVRGSVEIALVAILAVASSGILWASATLWAAAIGDTKPATPASLNWNPEE